MLCETAKRDLLVLHRKKREKKKGIQEKKMMLLKGKKVDFSFTFHVLILHTITAYFSGQKRNREK